VSLGDFGYFDSWSSKDHALNKMVYDKAHNNSGSGGGVTIHGYGLMIGLGVLCAIFLAEFRAKQRGLNTDQVFNIFFLY
jgi:prolipoprotein diacylglyceryltransferase